MRVGVGGLGKHLEEHYTYIVLESVLLQGLAPDKTSIPPASASESCKQVPVSQWQQQIAQYGQFSLGYSVAMRQVNTGLELSKGESPTNKLE